MRPNLKDTVTETEISNTVIEPFIFFEEDEDFDAFYDPNEDLWLKDEKHEGLDQIPIWHVDELRNCYKYKSTNYEFILNLSNINNINIIKHY